MSHTLVFCPAAASDAHILKDIAADTIRVNYTPFLGVNLVNSFIESGQSDNEIDDGLNNCTLILSNGIIVGFAIVNEAVLHLLMVAPEYQGCGYGSKLLAHVERQMFKEHALITLQTFKTNVNAIDFYKKHGWHPTDEQMVEGMDIPLVIFRKTI